MAVDLTIAYDQNESRFDRIAGFKRNLDRGASSHPANTST